MEILSLEVEEIEGYVFPILGWVAVALVAVLLLGGVGLGFYIRSRYFNVIYILLYIPLSIHHIDL